MKSDSCTMFTAYVYLLLRRIPDWVMWCILAFDIVGMNIVGWVVYHIIRDAL